jgi:hypothetical protein
MADLLETTARAARARPTTSAVAPREGRETRTDDRLDDNE